jgi:hypothetical protein
MGIARSTEGTKQVVRSLRRAACATTNSKPLTLDIGTCYEFCSVKMRMFVCYTTEHHLIALLENHLVKLCAACSLLPPLAHSQT